MPKATECNAPGCDNPRGQRIVRGYCRKHLYRWQKYGDPLAVERVIAQGSPEERWMTKVVVESPGCWIWQGHTESRGYGLYRYTVGRSMSAHRWVWEYLVGPIPDGLQLDHLCQVKCCVNPDHLEPVTARENSLRTYSVFANYARRTHCKHGHEYTPENTRYYPHTGNARHCLTCEREHSRKSAEARKARRRAARAAPNKGGRP